MGRKKSNKNLKLRLLVFAILMVAFSSIFLFESKIYNIINVKGYSDYENVVKQDVVLHFVDVGQGDAIALELPNGKNMLIDSGPRSSSEKLIDYLTNTFFKDKNNRVFDYFIITHPHEDHIGGSVKVFESFQINSFYRPNVYSKQESQALNLEYGENYITANNIYDTNIFKEMIEASNNEPSSQVIFFANYSLPVIKEDDFTLTFLTPNNVSYSNLNNYSPIMLMEVANKKLLFTGDAEQLVETEAITKSRDLIKDIDVLKVGHHGSSTSSSKQFISLTNPNYAIIQVGKDNSYNHPNSSTLDNLELVNAKVLRNDLNGNILLGFSNSNEIFAFVTTNTTLPIAIEVWQIYLTGGIIAFYFVVIFDWKKFKIKVSS